MMVYWVMLEIEGSRTHHWCQKGHTGRQGNNSRNELQLGKALAQDIKRLTGRDTGPENVAAKSKDQTRTLKQSRAREDGVDARNVTRVGYVPPAVKLEEGVVLEEAFFYFSSGWVTADRTTRVEHRSWNADNGVGRGQGAEK